MCDFLVSVTKEINKVNINLIKRLNKVNNVKDEVKYILIKHAINYIDNSDILKLKRELNTKYYSLAYNILKNFNEDTSLMILLMKNTNESLYLLRLNNIYYTAYK